MSAAMVSKSEAKKQLTGKPINWGRIVTYVVLVLFAIIYAGPLLMLVNTSLKTLPEFMKDATPVSSSLNFKNFVGAWNKASFPAT